MLCLQYGKADMKELYIKKWIGIIARTVLRKPGGIRSTVTPKMEAMSASFS